MQSLYHTYLVLNEISGEASCRCTACILGTELVNVNFLAYYVFLCIRSCRSLFGLSMLAKLICGVREGTSPCEDFSAEFDGKGLPDMLYFGILRAPHARLDYIYSLIHKLKNAGYLEEYTVHIEQLSQRQDRLAYRLTPNGLKALENPSSDVYIRCIRLSDMY